MFRNIMKNLGIVFLLISGLYIVSIFVNKLFVYDSTPPQDVNITIERTTCFGTCPDYKLTIYGDGKVFYYGRYFVQSIGPRIKYIPKSKVQELVSEIKKSNFFGFEDNYISPLTDMPSIIISVNLEGKSKTIDIYGWAGPEELMNLIQQIEETVNIARWVGD